MKKIFLAAFLSIILMLTFNSNIHKNIDIFAQSDECSNVKDLDLIQIEGCLAELKDALESSKKATQPLESQLQNLENRLAGIEARVNTIEVNLEQKRQEIATGYKELEAQQNTFNSIVKNSYIKTYSLSPMLLFFSSADPTDFIKFLTYQKQDAERDKAKITNIAMKLVDLERKKTELEEEERTLASVKETLSQERTEVEEIVLGAKEFQETLSGQIAELSAKQQQIINERSGGFTATIGDSDLADDYNASIKGFRESAPSGSFAVFSFGAHTHRKGMSQYGARGRAENGQSVNQILNAYYGKEPVDKDTNGTIKVQGHGEVDFEGRYLLGIAEMPSSWHVEALKAQAIAARTYAYRYKNEGKEICTTEACQVFRPDKADNPPDAWRQAVEDTKGKVLEDVVTYYASTHGGYADPIGWDTTDGSGGGNFIDKAYDKLGGSPWLYKSWYTKGYSPSSAKCGRSSPWLTPEEMADIVNAAIALKTSGIDTERITPVTTSCWGGDPYSMGELRDLVADNGGISSANSVSVSQGDGSTNSVVINGVNLSGSEFKKAFNLRAPGYLSIPQSSFAFFNIEHK